MIRPWIKRAAFAATVGLLVSQAGAAPVDLTAPGSSATLAAVLAQPGPDAGKFIVFDKLFTITNFTPAAGAPGAFQTENILVTGRNNGLDGVGFRLFNQWADNPGDPSAFGFTIAYEVNVLPDYAAQGVRIAGVNLSFNGQTNGVGSVSSVDESVFDGANLLGTARVEALDGTPPVGSAIIPLTTPLLGVSIVKDFKVFSPSSTGFATASFIEQTFKQVPAPGAGVLAVIGAGLIARRRRNG